MNQAAFYLQNHIRYIFNTLKMQIEQFISLQTHSRMHMHTMFLYWNWRQEWCCTQRMMFFVLFKLYYCYLLLLIILGTKMLKFFILENKSKSTY